MGILTGLLSAMGMFAESAIGILAVCCMLSMQPSMQLSCKKTKRRRFWSRAGQLQVTQIGSLAIAHGHWPINVLSDDLVQ